MVRARCEQWPLFYGALIVTATSKAIHGDSQATAIFLKSANSHFTDMAEPNPFLLHCTQCLAESFIRHPEGGPVEWCTA